MFVWVVNPLHLWIFRKLRNGASLFHLICVFVFTWQDGLTGSAWGDWANYTASPLRAFENELGVQDPVGFWDPAGFTADGSVENFKRRRQTELKHGRISMLATMGYITPERLVCKFFSIACAEFRSLSFLRSALRSTLFQLRSTLFHSIANEARKERNKTHHRNRLAWMLQLGSCVIL